MKSLNALLPACALLLASCTPHAWLREGIQTHSASDTAVRHTLFLIGDCGKPSGNPAEPSLALLHDMAAQAGEKGTVLFLGDNAYDRGLPDPKDPARPEMERRLLAQTAAVQGSGGKMYMIPGNHDWDLMGKGGWEAVRREEAFVEAAWANGNTFRPDQGCPGPSVVHPAEGIVLLMLDSQWWMHKHARPGKADGCTASTEAEFLQALRDTLNAYKSSEIIVAAHHPVWTYGTHGGHFGLKYHIFPMLMFKKNLYVPLPVLGSLAVWFRKLFGNSTDCSHPTYKRYRAGLRAVFSEYPGLIYAAGHEHNLQHSQEGHTQHIVSGSGTKSQSVGHGKYARYTNGAKGFARIDFLEGGGKRLSFVLPNGGCTYDYSVLLD